MTGVFSPLPSAAMGTCWPPPAVTTPSAFGIVAAAKCVAVLTGHTDQVFSAVFHPDGKRLASAGRDRAIWLWDLATGQEVARLEGHTNYVFSLAFSPDGT